MDKSAILATYLRSFILAAKHEVMKLTNISDIILAFFFLAAKENKARKN